MSARSSEVVLERLAEKYRLRSVGRPRHFLGIAEGLLVDWFEAEGCLRLVAIHPEARITGEIVLEKFRSFHHCQEAGIPTDWIKPLVLNDAVLNTQGCFLELPVDKLDFLPPATLAELPRVLAQDLRACGATPSPGPCSFCAEAEASEVLDFQDHYRVACGECFENLQSRSPGQEVELDQPIRWPLVLPTLALAATALALGWGWLQQPKIEGHEVRMLLLAPFLGSLAVCNLVGRAAGGMTTPLRIATAGAILVAILAGNIWGYRSAVLLQQPVSWTEAVAWYFQYHLPNGETSSGLFLFGGLAGTWLGFRMLRARSVARFS